MAQFEQALHHVVMDVDATTKKRVKADGSWTNSVQTRNVDLHSPTAAAKQQAAKELATSDEKW